MALDIVHWEIVLGSVLGELIAAPLAAYICKNCPPGLALVGILLMFLTLRNLGILRL